MVLEYSLPFKTMPVRYSGLSKSLSYEDKLKTPISQMVNGLGGPHAGRLLVVTHLYGNFHTGN